jgi:hypothetical protein
MFCSKCGAEHSEDSQFCRKCGQASNRFLHSSTVTRTGTETQFPVPENTTFPASHAYRPWDFLLRRGHEITKREREISPSAPNDAMGAM